MMHVIAYTSELDPTAGDADAIINDIVTVSKENNTATDITGVLFYHQGRFLQIIEGEEETLRALAKQIEADKRHKNFQYLIDTEEKERGFGGWKMDEIQLGKGKNFDAAYLESITKSFEKLMVPSCDMLAHFYKTLLQERKRIAGLF